jgi:predicted alpha/beta hydrolase family esterase
VVVQQGGGVIGFSAILSSMKKQIIVIGGANSYDSYKDYIASLKRLKLDWKTMRQKGWKDTLAEKLGNGFEVVVLRMPNTLNAKYLEWKIWFEKIVPHTRNNVTLVGHSMGAIFLAKYLSENKFSINVKGIFLVSPPAISNGPKESLADFILPKDMGRLEAYGEKVHLYYSTDDALVHLPEFKIYMKILPRAQKGIFKDRGHFTGKSFPEIVKDIKNLYK